eukprot:scaffold6794_cov46-Attheya_sp.AAC.3
MKTVSGSTVIGFFFAICLGLKLEFCQAKEEETCVVNKASGEKTCSRKKSSKFDDALLGEIEWLRQAGGVFHEHQEVRFEDPNDQYSGYGVFATELIPNGELLARIPWRLIIKPPEGLKYKKSALTCATVDALIKEIRLGDESDFAPFVNRLNENPASAIPESWTSKGLKMLKTLVGMDLPPQGVDRFWMKDEWFGTCQGSLDPLEMVAAIHVLTRAEDDLMVPINDLYNHGNGKWFNSEIDYPRGEDFRIMATRDIQAVSATGAASERQVIMERPNFYGTMGLSNPIHVAGTWARESSLTWTCQRMEKRSLEHGRTIKLQTAGTWSFSPWSNVAYPI